MLSMLYEAMAVELSRAGHKVMFGVLGEGNLLLVHELVSRHRMEYVAAAREDGAVLMADGYSRVSGETGVATVTHGPALTNAVTALTEATRSRTPVLLLAGDTSTEEPHHLQDISQEQVVASTGAGCESVRTPERALSTLRAASDRARRERRPIVLNIPANFYEREVDTAPWLSKGHPVSQSPAPVDPSALDEALGLILSSRRPIILAGKGAVQADSHDLIVQLSHRIGAPLTTTLLAKDWFSAHPWNLGIFGTLSTYRCATAVSDADCIIVLGASLNEFTTSYGNMLKGKRTLHVEVDSGRIGRNYDPTAVIIGDCEQVLKELLWELERADCTPSKFAASLFGSQSSTRRGRADFEDASGMNTIDMRTLMLHLDDLLPRDRIVVTDAGHSVIAPIKYLSVPHPSSFVFPLGFGSIGLALAEAVGCALARPKATVVAVVGDGGLMMGLSEFSTAVRYALNVIVVVLNDCSYSMEYHRLVGRGLDPGLSMFEWPEFAAVAESLGGSGITVRSRTDLEGIYQAVANLHRPLLIDAKTDPSLRVGFYD